MMAEALLKAESKDLGFEKSYIASSPVGPFPRCPEFLRQVPLWKAPRPLWKRLLRDDHGFLGITLHR